LLLFLANFGLNYCYGQFYQGSYQEYGKNRVQYNGFSWKYHNYKRFKIHYSGANKDLAIYVARTLHNYLKDAENKLDYTFPEKMELIVYESQSKFRQSNLGLSSDETTEIGGGSRIVGSKIFVYYPGNHQDFNKLIKSAVYEVLIKHMFLGEDWKNQIKLNTNMPFWLEKGLINYLVEEWNPEVESKLKDLILTKRINHFNNLNSEEKIIAGQAIWKFISESYGPTTIPSILSLTRVTNNSERSFHSILGLDYVNLSQKYISFFKSRYIEEYKSQNEPQGKEIKFKHKKESTYYSIKPSSNGDDIVYIENTIGRYRIKIYNKKTGKTSKIFAAEPKMERIQDYSYPIVEWHPNGKAIAFFSEYKGEVIFYIYSLLDKSLTKKQFKGFDKILSFDYSPSGNNIVISAVVNGQTDLFTYKVSGGNKTQLTNDIFDDLYPRFTDSYNIVFSSNRLSDTIGPLEVEINFTPQKNDLFIYPLNQSNHTFKYLKRITQTPNINETQPFSTQNNKIQFLSDENGLYNRYESNRDSSIAFIDTSIHYNYSFNSTPLSNCVTSINEHYVSKFNDHILYTIYQNGHHKIFLTDGSPEPLNYFKNTTYKEKQLNKGKKNSSIIKNSTDTTYVNNVYYQKTIINIGENKPLNSNSNSNDSIKLIKQKFKAPKYTIYKTNFTKDFIITQFDNNFLFPNYQTYNGPGSVYFNPGMNALLKIGASDLFDDYKLLAGIRIPTGLNNGGEQLLMIENLKNRLDHRLLYYRQKIINSSQFSKGITHDIRYRLNVPISEVLAVRATANLRQDKQIFIPYSDLTLKLDPLFNHTTGLNIELVFDNTIPMELNIRRGSRFKIFSEVLRGIEAKSTTINLGIDFRQYTRIKRNLIWVNRLAVATSLGTKKLLYYMGGVDNWILRPTPDFNNDVDVDPSQNYGYQTIATPLRGFIQNTRNGSSFFLFSSELRLPIFTFFSSYPIKSDMVRHFQIVAFTDIGSAWTGAHPLSPDNYFNTQIINDNPITISVQNLREPIVGSIGFGLRSKIWGYFVRLDAGWGIENLTIQKPKVQLSLSLDI
jgi:hypothetical protein